MSLKVFWCGAALFMNLLLARSAALSLPPGSASLVQLFNASAPYSASNVVRSDPKKCTRNDTWFAPMFEEEDCESALLYLWLDELPTGGTENMEFLDRRARPRYPNLEIQETPRKYTFGTYHLTRFKIFKAILPTSY